MLDNVLWNLTMFHKTVNVDMDVVSTFLLLKQVLAEGDKLKYLSFYLFFYNLKPLAY